jgi:hypothetical protein
MVTASKVFSGKVKISSVNKTPLFLAICLASSLGSNPKTDQP